MSDRVEVLPRAFEDIYVAFYRRIARGEPDAEQRDEDDLYWLLTGVAHSMGNVVLRAHWQGVDPETLRELIATTLRPFQMREVPMVWYLWPRSHSADLGDHLTASGLTHAGDSPMMALDLTLPLPPAEAPSGVSIERVTDPETYTRWVTVALDGFGFSDETKVILRPMIDRMGYDEQALQYLAWLDGEPVATATLFLGDENAAIFNVTTLPKARGKGVGSAITARCLRDAHDTGCHYALLLSSAMGASMYRHLGFTTQGTVAYYYWLPSSPQPVDTAALRPEPLAEMPSSDSFHPNV